MSVDPYIIISEALEALILQEFAAEKFPVVHDRLHESIGHKGTRIGISPEDQSPQANNMLVLDTDVLIQFYGRYDLKIDPDQRVDPRIVTTFAHRLRERFSGTGVQGSEAIWYFNIVGTAFPEDPTGNKTRFEMRIRAKGANSMLTETI